MRKILAHIGCVLFFIILSILIGSGVGAVASVVGWKSVAYEILIAIAILFSLWGLIETLENNPNISRTNNSGPR